MHKSIPPGAALQLDFIASKEAPNGYVTIFGNHQNLLSKQITVMTLDELIENQRGFSAGFVIDGKRQKGSSASGRYQFMRDTLLGLKKEMKLTGSEVFTPDLQDLLGYQLLIRRGYHKFMAGSMSLRDYGDRLAMEWASFPVLSIERDGAHRRVKRGQTYYAGDGINKVLIHPEAVEYVLTQARDLFTNAPMAGGASLPPPAPSVATVAHTAPPEPVIAPPRPRVPQPAPTAATPAPAQPGGLLNRFAAWVRGRNTPSA